MPRNWCWWKHSVTPPKVKRVRTTRVWRSCHVWSFSRSNGCLETRNVATVELQVIAGRLLYYFYICHCCYQRLCRRQCIYLHDCDVFLGLVEIRIIIILLETGLQLMTNLILVVFTMKPTPCPCLASSLLNQKPCPSSVVVSPHFL